MYLVVAVSCITGTAFWSVAWLLVQAAAAELRHLLYPPLENRRVAEYAGPMRVYRFHL